MLTMRIEGEHAVPHATWSRKLSIFKSQHVNQSVCVDVIEVVAARNIGTLSLEERGKVEILTIEVDDVGVKASLLQQVRTSREIRNPRLCLFGPGFVTVEPLTEGSEGESRLLVD